MEITLVLFKIMRIEQDKPRYVKTLTISGTGELSSDHHHDYSTN